MAQDCIINIFIKNCNLLIVVIVSMYCTSCVTIFLLFFPPYAAPSPHLDKMTCSKNIFIELSIIFWLLEIFSRNLQAKRINASSSSSKKCLSNTRQHLPANKKRTRVYPDGTKIITPPLCASRNSRWFGLKFSQWKKETNTDFTSLDRNKMTE